MIFLLRHGETLWNRQDRLQGQLDSPLTCRGIGQVRAMGRCLKRELPDPARFRMIASPLGRAWQSAVIVAETLGLDPGAMTFDERLKEISFGSLEGRLMSEIHAEHPGLWEARLADRWDWLAPDGESYALLDARVGAWLAEQPRDADLIVVCHGVVSRVLRGRYANLTREQIPVQSESQDELWRLERGLIETLECGD